MSLRDRNGFSDDATDPFNNGFETVVALQKLFIFLTALFVFGVLALGFYAVTVFA